MLPRAPLELSLPEREIRQYGPGEALIRTIRRGKKTDGLLLLAEYNRLDCAYEQIALDYAHEMPEDVVERARQILADFAGRRPGVACSPN